MSLRLRINFLITLLFIVLFIVSSFFILTNSRHAVHQEVESTAKLALKLVQIAIASVASNEQANGTSQMQLLKRLTELDETRHLYIDIQDANQILTTSYDERPVVSGDAPAWFAKLVEPPPTEIKHWVYTPVSGPIGVIIRANPVDEIDENWIEVRSMLIFLLVFIILANILVYITIGRYLSPIGSILNGLEGIEKGNYKNELPRFDLPELDRISQQFNHMAKVLLRSKQENQLLTQRSLKIQEEERRHLAQELHDELGQTITAIKAIAVAINSNKQPEPEQIENNVKTIVEYSDHTYQVAKNMMHRLRPSVLDEFGLVKALQNMIDDWNSRQDDIFCHFNFTNIPADLTDDLKINLFRIIQESMTNAQKHSAASELIINMQVKKAVDKKLIHLTIKDDGVGLDKENMQPGLGLLGMRERVEMHAGQFELTSSINQGVFIEINIPL